MPNCYVESLLRSTIAVRMGDRENARLWLDRALELRPELVRKPEFVLGRVFVINEERDFLIDGMRLSGFAGTAVRIGSAAAVQPCSRSAASARFASSDRRRS